MAQKKETRSFKATWTYAAAPESTDHITLKDQYEPDDLALDFIVEDILQRSFANGTLEKKEAVPPIDYYELTGKWRNIDVEEEITAYIDKYLK